MSQLEEKTNHSTTIHLDKKRYALVGTGSRAVMFIDPLVDQFSDDGELVGMCDLNPTRLAYHNNRIKNQFNHSPVPIFSSDEFDQMIKQTRPDCVIVCTVDAFHHEYVVRAMELGCDAITEKPMTTDDAKCRAIFDAIDRTGKTLRIAFNCRWGPGATQVRELLQSGIIGEVLHVDLEYMLNTSHGADYFRRWHRDKDKSGGLIVHKSTHHFDLVNWWIDAVPQTVFGMGRLAFYGKKNAENRGIDVKYDRYTGHNSADDPFSLNLTKNETLKALFLDAEQHDGYQRDRNVFGNDITIEDSMSVMVRYRTGVILNYSLNAYLPREGFHVAFNGTKGRLEYTQENGSHIIESQRDREIPNEIHWENKLTIQPLFEKSYSVPVKTGKGTHGGSDPLIQEQIFSSKSPNDILGRNAFHEQGAASILVGIAANQSFVTGQPVDIATLCPKLPGVKRLSELK